MMAAMQPAYEGNSRLRPPPGMRASDADREAVANSLRRHCAAGRLEVEELEERLAATFAARVVGDLEALLADLPRGRPKRPPSNSIRVGAPGLQRFHQVHELPVSRAAAFRSALDHIVPSMVAAGYDVVARTSGELLVFETTEHPAWVPFACVLLFPVGLLALTVSYSYRVVVSFDARGPDTTRLVVHGTARRPVRKAFAELQP
jgi:hypothetical protein